MCNLEKMWSDQRELNKRIGVDPEKMDDQEKRDWIIKYLAAFNVESSELLDSIGYKWWRPYESQPVDPQNAKVEVVDMFHFFISIAQMVDMTADDLYRIYCEKNKVNHNRQDSGYFKKNENDCSHIK